MSTLGVVLAGGRSRRFGRDKALATIAGVTLLEMALDVLRDQCDQVCVAGRLVAGVMTTSDWPAPGMGPLGGIAGALRMAVELGHAQVLSTAVDIPDLPGDLLTRLDPAPSCIADQPVVGLWRSADLPSLEALLKQPGSHSLKAFVRACNARSVTLPLRLANLNTQRDLVEFARRGTRGLLTL